MRKQLAVTLLAIFAALLPTLRAQTVISIANAGFETPTTTTFANLSGSDWQLGTTTSAGLLSYSDLYSAGKYSPASAPGGNQVGFINQQTGDNFIYQDVGVNYIAGATYSFSAYFGARTDDPSATGSVRLYTTSGTLLATSGVITPTAGGSFEFGVVNYVALAGVDGLGIRVVIANESLQQLNFDVAQLTVTAIPEPSTYAAIFGALTLVVAGVRGHRRRNIAA